MRKIFLSILIVFVAPVSASVVVPGDGPYFRFHRDRTTYIYDDEGREVVDQLAAYHEVFRRMYDKSFDWQLDERQDLILASYRQQVGNAYATLMPNIKSLWFESGASFLDETATSSWLLTLDAHETAHLYQLNAKGRFNATIKPIFGNALGVFLFGVPIIIHPNFLTPVFLLEGNAVLQESRINRGGRLHSGEVRALVLAQIKAGLVDPNFLINDVFHYPFGQRRYLQGGYFQAHLAAKYGIDKTNSFFKAQGDHWLWPFILNKTFRDHFGSSYPQEIREYVRGLDGLANKQVSTVAPPLLRSVFVSPLNHDADRIWFTTTDGSEPVKLRVFDKKNRLVVSRSYDLGDGKVFFVDGKPEITESDQNDLHHITYSLYGEGRRIDSRYRGQIVTDQRAGKTAALDATHAWFESRVLIDGVPFDIAHSNPILDDAGNVYYFRQNGAERILYKNREPVFKYEGFYGKLTEVEADGSVLFIGNTDYGSTLYRYKDQEIVRVLPSDRVVDARRISENEFLTVDVDADGHSIHLVAPDFQPAQPAVYSYGFASENVTPEKSVSSEQVKADEVRYNGLAALRFSSLDFVSAYQSHYGLLGSATANFADPMDYHNLSVGFAGSSFRDRAFDFAYAYKRYLVNWVVYYRYLNDWWRSLSGVEHRAYNQDVAGGIVFPFLRHGNWDGGFSTALTYSHDHRHTTRGQTEDDYGVRSRLEISHEVSTKLGMFPWRQFSLALDHKITTATNAWTKEENSAMVSTAYHHGFRKNFYLSAFGNVAWAEHPDIAVQFLQMPWPASLAIPMLTLRDTFYVKNAESLRLELHKVFNVSSYSPRIFIGLDRLAPLLVAQGVAFDASAAGDYPPNNFEWGYGVDLGVLMFHSLHSSFRVINAYNTREPDKIETQAELSIKQTW